MISRILVVSILGASLLLGPVMGQQQRGGNNGTQGESECIQVDSRAKCPDKRIKFVLFNRRTGKAGVEIALKQDGSTNRDFRNLFNINAPLKVIVHGIVTEYMTPELFVMRDHYLKRSDCSVIFVNYEPYATMECYQQAINNIHHVGSCIGQMLSELTFRVGVKDIHLIAYSMGSHVAGYVAKALAPYRIARITALDPAPVFLANQLPDEKLDPTDAEFVDAYYTSALSWGENKGHVGFYFNGGLIQPGCVLGTCSHSRAVEYFRESILSPTGFYGVPCGSYFSFMFGLCGKEEIQAGDGAPNSVEGMYFVTTNDDPPYARGRSRGKETNRGRNRV